MKPTTELRINQMYFKVLPCASASGDIWADIAANKWDAETFEFFNQFIHPDKNFIDIGGWIGTTTLQAYAFNPRKIFSIEAEPSNYQILKHNIALNLAGDKITPFNVCLTDKANSNRIMKFGTANKEKPNRSSQRLDNGSRISVKTTHALPFLKRNCELNKTNCINIDIEGSEKYLCDLFKYLSIRKDISVLLSLHSPYWGKDQDQVSKNISESIKKFTILDPFSYKQLTNQYIYDKMMDKSQCIKEPNLKGQFFSIALQGKQK